MNTAARNDLALYDRRAEEWWDERRGFARTLHGINALRLRHLVDELGQDLRGLVIVDLGCGGGLLAEPLSRQGAHVIGIDLSERTVAAARAHGSAVTGLRYLIGDARRPPLPDGSADVVIAADLLEHVDGWPSVLAAARRLLAPGGRVYVSTINRTRRARWLAVGIAERLGLIPRGTHDAERFITPDELRAAASSVGLRCTAVLGERLRIAATIAEWRVRVSPGTSTAVGYAAWFARAEA